MRQKMNGTHPPDGRFRPERFAPSLLPKHAFDLRLPCAETRKFAVIDEVRARLVEDGAEINDAEGIRVKTGDGWWLLRASSTQDALVVRGEAATPDGLTRLKRDLTQQLAKSGVAVAEGNPGARG